LRVHSPNFEYKTSILFKCLVLKLLKLVRHYISKLKYRTTFSTETEVSETFPTLPAPKTPSQVFWPVITTFHLSEVGSFRVFVVQCRVSLLGLFSHTVLEHATNSFVTRSQTICWETGSSLPTGTPTSVLHSLSTVEFEAKFCDCYNTKASRTFCQVHTESRRLSQ